MLDKAEDPEKMVKQIIIDMEAQVNSATQALGAAMGSEKQALKQLETAKASSEDWNKKAKLALQSGNEELAKKALSQKASVDSNIVTFQASYEYADSTIKGSGQRVKIKTGRSKNETEYADRPF
jgi:phage shock protein A